MKAFSSLTVRLDGLHLVEASAGTGKTHAITTLVLRLLLGGLRIEQIVVLTFTDAATEELKARIRRRLQEALDVFSGIESSDVELTALHRGSEGEVARDRARLLLALRNVDQAAVFTINGFCQRVLQEHAFDSGVRFDAELKSDLSELRQQVMAEFWVNVAETGSIATASLLRGKITPQSWAGLAKTIVGRPALRIQPPLADAPCEIDDLQAAFEQAKASWDRGAIEELLLGHHALKGYTERFVVPWVVQVDAFLHGVGPPLREIPKRWDKFTVTEMKAQLKKGKTEADLPKHPFFDAAEAYDVQRVAYEGAQDRAVLMLNRRFVDFVSERWPQRMRQAGWLSFSDQIHLVDAALEGAGGEALARAVRGRFKVALIDEFQDTDRAQYRIFHRLWSEGSLYLIGDPKQAIYGFRGAEIFAYLHAASQVPKSARHTMGINWRSDPTLIRAVQTLFEGVTDPFVLDGLPFVEVGPREGAADVFVAQGGVASAPLEVLFVSGAQKMAKPKSGTGIARAVAREIRELIDSGSTIAGKPIVAQDIAVLTRENDQTQWVQHALLAEGLHAVVRGNQSVFEEGQLVTDDLRSVLAAVIEPRYEPLLRGALLTSLYGKSANDLDALQRDDAKWGAWVERFTAYRRLWIDKGFARMFKVLLVEGAVEARLLHRPDGERQLTNLRHLMELTHAAEREQHLGPTAVTEWFDAQRCAKKTRGAEDVQLRLEREDEAVTVITLHKSKGLQFPIVYLPFCWPGVRGPSGVPKPVLFHDENADHAATLDLAREDANVQCNAREQLAEDLRLFYVGLTRAKHRCSVVWGRLKGHETSALSYLLRPQASRPVAAVAELRSLYDGLEEADLRMRLDEKFAENPGSLAVRSLPMDLEPSRRALSHASPAQRAPREVGTRVRSWWRVTSFSGLASAGSARHLDDVREQDENLSSVPALAPAKETREPCLLSDFPGGTKAGNFFHSVLERIAFDDLSDEALHPQVERGLQQYGFSAPTWTATVSDAVRSMMTTQLGVGSEAFCLAEVDGWLPEFAFHIPLGQAKVAQVVASQLADVLRAHPSERLLPSYADRLERLGFAPVEGLLKGYIDLVMRKDGRWYLADYKSNYLGEDMDAYRADRLPAAMAHGHYYLQAHLYCVALHRYLECRLSDYDYDLHFGGVHYLFLRGMRSTTGPSHGVFFERPPKGRIEALSRVLAGTRGEKR